MLFLTKAKMNNNKNVINDWNKSEIKQADSSLK